ncbi:MAG: ribosomal protein glutamine methyltransferase [Pseudomonadota bacterium]|jgi:ribosomal protein L3 glutamine methyltransferase
MTLTELVTQAAERLQAAGVAFGQGTLNAWDEAAWLVLWRLGLPLDTELDAHAGDLDPAGIASVQALIEARIAQRLPAAYLTGEAWLQGVPFDIDPRSIIPRSLIAEVLAEGQIDAWLGEDPAQVLDLCTGNGSLAVLAALAWPQAQVTGADISPDALAVAERNRARHGLGERLLLHCGNGLQGLRGPYDLILCNPPYVSAARMAALPAEFRAEPELALAGGQDGMDFVRELLQQAASVLQPNGVLVLEIGNEIEHFQHAFPQLSVVGMETSAGDEQVLLITREALLAAHGPTQVAP